MSKRRYESKDEVEDEDQQAQSAPDEQARNLTRFTGLDKANVLATLASLVNPFSRRMTPEDATKLLLASNDVITDLAPGFQPVDFREFPLIDLTHFGHALTRSADLCNLREARLAHLVEDQFRDKCQACQASQKFSELAACFPCLSEHLPLASKLERRQFLITKDARRGIYTLLKSGSHDYQFVLVKHPLQGEMLLQNHLLACQFVDSNVFRCIGASGISRNITYREHTLTATCIVDFDLYHAQTSVFTDSHCFIFTTCLLVEEQITCLKTDGFFRAVCLDREHRFLTATVFQKRIVVIGGEEQDPSERGSMKIASRVTAFDPAQAKWDADLPMLPQSITKHSAVVFQGKLWVAGGQTVRNGKLILNEEVFNFDGHAWATAGRVKSCRLFPFLFVFENNLFLLGGKTSNKAGQERFLERYDLVSGTFENTCCVDSMFDNVV
jgi:hypothetical protein